MRRTTGGDFPALVPEGWSSGRINYRFSVTLGKMLDAGRAPKPGDVNLPYIRAANIQDDGLALDDVYEMPFTPAERVSLSLRAGDLLVVEGGAVGTNHHLREGLPGWGFQKTERIQAVIATQSFPANRRILPPVSATRVSCGGSCDVVVGA